MKRLNKDITITIVAVLAAFVSVGYMSCKKDSTTPSPDLCTNVVCQNGGTCFKGACSCPGGFEGEHCETKVILRYIGTWDVTEKVESSSNQAAVGTAKSYKITIREKDKLVFLIDDFMGNPACDNVEATAGKDSKMQSDMYTHFGFKQLQGIAGTTYIINAGEGSVNDFGTYISGNYIRAYPDSSGFITDSVSFSAARVQ